MSKKIVTVFTEGDSSDLSVWSNVPYLLTTTLEAMGYEINRVNLNGNVFIQYFYDKILFRVLRHTLLKRTTFSYSRSILFHMECQIKMFLAVGKNPSSDYYISTSFSFSPYRYTNQPTVLLCDWTYEYFVRHFNNRVPDFLENKAILRQNKIIENSSHIFVLFPDTAKEMQEKYKNKNIHYIGNVVNCATTPPKENNALVKKALPNLVFIGVKKYKDGILALISAFQILKKEHPNIQLNIIGMSESDFDFLPTGITCHGYLNKSHPKQNDTYYRLLSQATIYINTTPKWAGFSSALEALYFFTPIITSRYNSFIENFGSALSFGRYCTTNTPEEIIEQVNSILELSDSNYSSLCSNAHNSVKDFTWSSYVDKMLKKMNVEK